MQLVAVFQRLFQRGDLIAIREQDETPVLPLQHGFIPTPEEIIAAMEGELIMGYWLTSQGGARWESASNPRWERYLTTASGPEYELIAGGSRQVVEAYLELVPYIRGVTLLPKSIVWEVETPWQATYWKLLPEGHVVSFQTTPAPYTPRPAWVEQRWVEIMQWYTNPFEE